MIECDACNGIGYIRVKDGQLDVCDKCYAMGSFDSRLYPGDKSILQRKRESTRRLLKALGIWMGATFSVVGITLLTLLIMEFLPEL